MPVPGGGRAGGGSVLNPGLWCLLSRLRRRQPQLLPEPDQDPRGPWCYVSGEVGAPEKRPARTCAAQVPAPDPAPRASQELSQHPPRIAGRATPAGPSSPRAVRLARAVSRPRDPKLIAGAAARNELILSERLVNNRGQLGPAPRPSSAPGTPLGEPQKSVSLVHALARPSV